MSIEQQTAADARGEQFKCPQCAGAMAWDAGARALRCGYCKHTAAVKASAGGPREIPLREGLARAPRGLGAAVQAVRCSDCGATVNLGPHDRVASCTYCASSTVVSVPVDPNLITPESLVPFLVPREKASAEFQTWLRGLWFRPRNLHRLAQLEQIVGVYVPYWTFDAEARSSWTAERGWHYYETEEYTEEENGQQVTRTRQVQRTRWEYASGHREDSYDDVLVCGSKGLPEKLVGDVATFDTAQLVAYAPGYLAGWRAESYAVDLADAWPAAQRTIEQSQESNCASDVGGDTHRSLSVSTDLRDETFKHVLLPVYVAAYRYQGKPFRFLVNGQSGEVVGEAPLSWAKILLLVVFVLALIGGGLAWWFATRNPPAQDPAPAQMYAPAYQPGYAPQGGMQPGYAPAAPAQ